MRGQQEGNGQSIFGNEGPQSSEKNRGMGANGRNASPRPQWARHLTAGQTSHVVSYYQLRMRATRLAVDIRAHDYDIRIHHSPPRKIHNPDSRKYIGRTNFIPKKDAREMLRILIKTGVKRRGRELEQDPETAWTKKLVDRGVRRAIYKMEKGEWRNNIKKLMENYDGREVS